MASLPNEGFNRGATVSFEADGVGSPTLAVADAGSGSDSGSEAIAPQSLTSVGDEDQEEEEGGDRGAAASFDVSFYHCNTGTFWNTEVDEATGDNNCEADGENGCCALCQDVVERDVEVLCL